MPYRDTWVACVSCGRQFVFTVEEQREQAQRGEEPHAPALCPVCQPRQYQESGERAPSRAPDRRERPAAREASGAAPRTSRAGETRARDRGAAPQAAPAGEIIDPGPHEGRVKWYKAEKGYGFITQSNGQDIFFHRSGVAEGTEPEFPDGTRVSYMIEHTEKGPQAVEVMLMD